MQLENRHVANTKKTCPKSSISSHFVSQPLFTFLPLFHFFSSSTSFPFTSPTEAVQVGSHDHCMTPGSGSEDDQETLVLEEAEAWVWMSKMSFCARTSGLWGGICRLTSQQRTLKAELTSLVVPALVTVVSASANHRNQIFICCAVSGLKWLRSWGLMGKG